MGRLRERLDALDRRVEARLPQVRPGLALLATGVVMLVFGAVDLLLVPRWSWVYEIPAGLVFMLLGIRERRNASRDRVER